MDLHPESANVSIADNFTVTCAASAYPLPNISWWHNSSLVDEANPRITISQTTGIRTVESTITTVNATTSDGGTYVCQVGAPPGTDFDTTDSDPALILVQGELGLVLRCVCVSASLMAMRSVGSVFVSHSLARDDKFGKHTVNVFELGMNSIDA